ncbi:hypothetical protein FACS1894178_4480 [Bacteroidia bacterium]|nr:hypothetical protein FACS1894178_4480 [Bacteroidia bacterium]
MEYQKEKPDYSILTKVANKPSLGNAIRENKHYQTNNFPIELFYKKITTFITKYPHPDNNNEEFNNDENIISK